MELYIEWASEPHFNFQKEFAIFSYRISFIENLHLDEYMGAQDKILGPKNEKKIFSSAIVIESIFSYRTKIITTWNVPLNKMLLSNFWKKTLVDFLQCLLPRNSFLLFDHLFHRIHIVNNLFSNTPDKPPHPRETRDFSRNPNSTDMTSLEYVMTSTARTSKYKPTRFEDYGYIVASRPLLVWLGRISKCFWLS